LGFSTHYSKPPCGGARRSAPPRKQSRAKRSSANNFFSGTPDLKRRRVLLELNPRDYARVDFPVRDFNERRSPHSQLQRPRAYDARLLVLSQFLFHAKTPFFKAKNEFKAKTISNRGFRHFFWLQASFKPMPSTL
jgi:hypothetical protein